MMKSFTTRLATWRQDRTSLRELSRLGERELADLGIGRADVRAAASGAPVVTSEDVDAVVTNRFAPIASLGADMPNPTRITPSPMCLAA